MKHQAYNAKMDTKAKEYLKLISHFTYDEFKADYKEGKIIECHIFEKPGGIIFIKKNKDSYSIKISFSDEGSLDVNEAYSLFNSYVESNEFRTNYAAVNGSNKNMTKKLVNEGFVNWFGTREYEYRGKYQYKADGVVLTPYEPGHNSDYIKLLGKAFEDMRRDNSLEPYDWYEANRDAASGQFIELAKDGRINGWWIDGKLAAVAIVEDDYLDTLAVSGDFQGKGLGTRLLDHIMSDLANVKGYPVVRLGLVASNTRAINLYTKRGFKQTTSINHLRKQNKQ